MISRLRQAVDASGEVIFMTDRQGIFTFVNRRFEQLYGYASAEVVGSMTPRVLKSGLAPEGVYAEMWQRLLGGRTVETSLVNRASDGRLIDIESTLSPICDDAKAIVGFLAIQRDVTARRRVEEELRFQHMVLATERELTLDGILVVDDQSRVLSFNGRFAQMWELPAEVLGTGADEVLLRRVGEKVADPAGFAERVRDLYARRDAFSHDEVALLDGRIFHRYSAPMRGSNGQYCGRVWYFSDVTDRRRTEQALQAERDRAQQYLDIADVILLALDLEGRVTLVNRKGCSILGWDEDELIGSAWVDRCVPEWRKQAFLDYLRGAQRGDLAPVETAVVTKSGEERVISWHNSVMKDERGRVVGTLSSGTDVTERNRAVEELRIAEERMRFALQNAGVGTWDIDYATGVLRWSEILEAQYGLQPGTFRGTFEAFVERLHPEDREATLETIGKATQSGADFRVDHRSLWPDGTVRWLAGAGRVLLGEHGEPVRGVGISLDVTPQKKLELELRHAQKLESVGRLAAGIAHEINTPVQFIGDSVRFVQDAIADLAAVVAKHQAVNDLVRAGQPALAAAEAASQAEHDMDLAYVLANIPSALDRSIDGLNRVAAIVQSMKEFAHPDRTEMTAVDLNRAIETTLTIAHNEYKFVADVETDFGNIPMVTCRGGDVNQVLLNILVNAAHAIGDTIEGRSGKGRIRIQTRLDGEAVEIRIADDGAGIPEPIRHRVFDPFFTTKEVGKGTGQGLAIARVLIVEKHGGQLTFESEVGRGTTFIVRLPIDQRNRSGVAA